MAVDDEPREASAPDATDGGVRRVSDEEFEAVLEASIERHRSILQELAKR